MTTIIKAMKFRLIFLLVLLAALLPTAASAEHIDFTGRDSVFAMFGSQTPRSKVFDDYYTKSILYPSTVTMLVYDGLSGNGQIAMENWFDNTPLSNDTHMRFAMTTNYNNAHLRFVLDSTPCGLSTPTGCWNPTVLSADSSRNAYQMTNVPLMLLHW